MTVAAIKGFRMDEIADREGTKARAAYFACVDYLDEIIGDFLSILEWDRLLENTVIVYTSGHGDMAGEHGLWWKNTWHESSVRVPLVISLPDQRSGARPGQRVEALVSLADLFPTLCGLAGSQAPPDLDGKDLTPTLHGERNPPLTERDGVIVESLAPRWEEGTEFRAIRSARLKYIAFRDCEDLAFDLVDDPDEQRNLIPDASGETAEELDRLRAKLYEGFDFDSDCDRMKARDRELRDRYPGSVKPRTPNQIRLGDGSIVEVDSPLYSSDVVSEDPSKDIPDNPED